MYAKCGSMEESREIFDGMQKHDVVSWTALILGYAENGEGELALELFEIMQLKGCQPNTRTFLGAAVACSSLAASEEGRTVDGKVVKMRSLEKGRGVYCEAARRGFDSDIFVGNSLVDMFAKCRSMVDAHKVFDLMPRRDVVTWTALMMGYAAEGGSEVVLKLFSRMETEPDALAFVAALMACGNAAAEIERVEDKVKWLEQVMVFHSQAADKGCLDMFLANTLVDTYAKCGSLVDSRMVFDRMRRHDVVSWTALIMGNAENDEADLALELFEAFLRCRDGQPNARTFVAALMACSSLALKEEASTLVEDSAVKLRSLETGFRIHSQAAKTAGCCDLSDVVFGNTLVDMYAKCGSLVDAEMVFGKIQCRDLVSWKALMTGYLDNGENELVLEVFQQMQQQGWVADALAFTSAIMASGNLAALETGKRFHWEICRRGMEMEGFIPNALVDFYGKCGRMVDAEAVFLVIQVKETVSWNALMAGYSRVGETGRVLGLFRGMKEEGIKADGVCFQTVLGACSHAGLVDEGRKCFEVMKSGYGVQKGIEHYHCMIDMFGRANQLERAVEVVESMPVRGNAVTWMTVLSACEKWRNEEVGRRAFEELLEIDSRHSAAYVLMSNVYGNF